MGVTKVPERSPETFLKQSFTSETQYPSIKRVRWSGLCSKQGPPLSHFRLYGGMVGFISCLKYQKRDISQFVSTIFVPQGNGLNVTNISLSVQLTNDPNTVIYSSYKIVIYTRSLLQLLHLFP